MDYQSCERILDKYLEEGKAQDYKSQVLKAER